VLQRRVQHLLDERRLSQPETPVEHTSLAVECVRRCSSGYGRSRPPAQCGVRHVAAGGGVAHPIRNPLARQARARQPAPVAEEADRRRPAPGCRNSRSVRRVRPHRGPGRANGWRSVMICGSCSTTGSELPASRMRSITAMTRPMSRACRPIDGSSSTKRVLTGEVPRAVVRLMRCTLTARERARLPIERQVA
jgi:hypothetical protein